MKKNAILMIAAIVAFFIFVNFPLQTALTAAKTTAIKLNYTKKVMVKGQKLQLKLSGQKAKIKWSSSSRTVASVSSKGRVIARRQGKTIITARVNGKKYTCSIIVKPPKGTIGNPYSSYEARTVSYYHPSLKTNSTFQIQLVDYQEKQNGFNLMQIYSSNNYLPEQGQKWIVMKFEIKYAAGPAEVLYASRVLNPALSFYSQNGKKHIKSMAKPDFGIYENNDARKTALKLNQTAEVLIAILTDEVNGYPLYRIPTGFHRGKNSIQYTWFTTKR